MITVPDGVAGQPRRNRCSSRKYEATASASEMPTLSAKSGTGAQSMRGGLSSTTTGQWYRYRP